MTMVAGDMQGGCACGRVRYRLIGPPIFVNNCHCSLCQRQTGAGSAINAFVESERLELITGELSSSEVPTGSGGTQTILRCSGCGTPLWAHYPRYGSAGAAVRVGTLDEPSAVAPDAAIFADDRPAWAALPEGVPSFPGYYDPQAVLPDARLERLRTLAAVVRAASAVG